MTAPGVLYARALTELLALLRAEERLSALWASLPTDLQDALHEQVRVVRRERYTDNSAAVDAPEGELPARGAHAPR